MYAILFCRIYFSTKQSLCNCSTLQGQRHCCGICRRSLLARAGESGAGATRPCHICTDFKLTGVSSLATRPGLTFDIGSIMSWISFKPIGQVKYMCHYNNYNNNVITSKYERLFMYFGKLSIPTLILLNNSEARCHKYIPETAFTLLLSGTVLS